MASKKVECNVITKRAKTLLIRGGEHFREIPTVGFGKLIVQIPSIGKQDKKQQINENFS